MRREICGECNSPITDDGSCICTELPKHGWRQCAVGQVERDEALLRQALEALKAENERLRDEAERLRQALAAMVSWFPSADTYRRLGFDPKTPMQVLKEAKATLAKEDKR